MFFLYHGSMLPAEYRLKKEEEIKTLFKKGRGVFDRFVGVKMKKNGLPNSRFVVVVGVKVHKRAIRRNRIRRQIRSVLFEHLSHITSGFDVGVIALPSITTATFEEVQISTLSALKRARLLSATPPKL